MVSVKGDDSGRKKVVKIKNAIVFKVLVVVLWNRSRSAVEEKRKKSEKKKVDERGGRNKSFETIGGER